MKRIFKVLIYLFTVLLILYISSKVKEDISKILITILSFSISLCLALLIVKVVHKFNTWLEEKDLKKERKKHTLYQWMSFEFDEKYLYDLLKRKKTKSDLENLKEIRILLKKSIGEDLNDYYLFKAYLEWSSQHSFFNSMKFFGTTIVTSFLTTILTQGFLFDKFKIIFINNGDLTEKIVEMLNLTALGIALIISIIIIFFESTKNRKKLELTKVILNDIIREMEGNSHTLF
ncbi:hypothetical protein [Lysinibacillus fusiformis]|uniref:hypothetical protein n=1 Tax=Lysinibacillus fusiformis TaxID=28031 RepID=UPI003017F405